MTTAAMHVAHGNGLPVPTWRTPIGSKSRESSAPPFLRRTVEELQAADSQPLPVTVARPKGKSKGAPPRRHKGRDVGPDEVQAIVDKYLLGWTLRAIAEEHAPISRDRVKAFCAGYERPVEAKVAVARGIGGRGRKAVVLDSAEVIGLYVDERVGIKQIGMKFKTDPQKVSALLKANGIVVTRNGWRP